MVKAINDELYERGLVTKGTNLAGTLKWVDRTTGEVVETTEAEAASE